MCSSFVVIKKVIEHKSINNLLPLCTPPLSLNQICHKIVCYINVDYACATNFSFFSVQLVGEHFLIIVIQCTMSL